MHAVNRHLQTASIFVVAVLFLAQMALAQQKPNIIMIMTDDQGIDAIEGAHWPNQLNCRTPRLSAFASEGRSFTNMRVNPLCSPSRAAILTGRYAIHTGVMGLIGDDQPQPDRDLLGLQTDETTIGEMLQAAGYYTMLLDKWHVGWNADMGQMPPQQGFDDFVDGRDLWPLDDPEKIGDEHISLIVNIAIDKVNNRPNPNQPYALILWTKDPHKRQPDSEGFRWWKFDPQLQPSGEDYYQKPETQVNRFRGNIEAIDTELGRMLQTIGVVDSQDIYQPSSNTVVFFLGDNGTDARVSAFGEKAKLSLFDGGIKVPFFVFGENVPADGLADERVVNGVDIYDTLADIAGADDVARGSAPRDSMSFADSIGWADALPQRQYSLSSKPSPNLAKDEVALASSQFKLIASAGRPGLQSFSNDEFYDLVNDPEENNDLLNAGMTTEQINAYADMRDALVDSWPVAVADKFQNAPGKKSRLPRTIDMRATQAIMYASTGEIIQRKNMDIGHLHPGHKKSAEARLFYYFDVSQLQGLTRNDIISSQIIIGFDQDPLRSNDEDTGPIRIYPMLEDPFAPDATWDSLLTAYGEIELGMVDIAPHVILDPLGKQLRGIPMEHATPISFGRSADLTSWAVYWANNPEINFGVVLIADPIDEISGDQHVSLMKKAILRVQVRR